MTSSRLAPSPGWKTKNFYASICIEISGNLENGSQTKTNDYPRRAPSGKTRLVRSSAEVDYVIGEGPTIFPVYVKAGKSGFLISLHVFLQEKKDLSVFVSIVICHPYWMKMDYV